ncbi:acyl-CoA mutase large subunit family protein [Romboutsia lituseburensis]|uniref:acyl-CoA mutase large subunit family protein n=1 Tax=Romboutsia lituseburensis TaxID=1537 RepID=UPI00215A8782|nr:methylmalonyl-CoA mutase family protein [Romboutsia lituseburensis]MCR8745805.1 methylmalonyl-CoA mutase family protein [Romboutsia lituseburensis]
MNTQQEIIKNSLEKWEETKVKKTLNRFPERKEQFILDTDEEVKRLYTPLDANVDYDQELGYPGQYPFTRGVQPTMYRGKLWTMRMYAGFATAEESNERYKYLIEQGSKGLSVAFDLPTQLGYDSDENICKGEVGKVGVAIDSLGDMEVLFKDIPLDKVSTSMTINAPSSVLLAMYIAVAKKQGVSVDKLRGTIQNDILKEYVARGTYIFPVQPSMRLTTDIFEYCSKELPNWNTISISGYHIREAGANAIQEVAFTLANGIAYVNAAINAGLDVDDFAPRLSFFFASHNNLLEEVSKFRAARRLWAKIMKERFNATNPKSCMLKFHTQTAGSTLTAQQPDNNIMRVTMQALAAVLGGTQSLHTNSRDEALSLPTEDSVTIALRTQQIIGEESGVCETIDPLAGSYYVESLTDQIEKEAMKIIENIDSMGGSPKAIENGYIQEVIMKSAYKYQQKIENKEKIIVGVNKYTSQEQEIKGLLKVDEVAEKTQISKLSKFKQSRDNEKTTAALERLRNACNTTDNMMPYIIEAVESYATLGEICKVMREEFGEYVQGDVF